MGGERKLEQPSQVLGGECLCCEMDVLSTQACGVKNQLVVVLYRAQIPKQICGLLC